MAGLTTRSRTGEGNSRLFHKGSSFEVFRDAPKLEGQTKQSRPKKSDPNGRVQQSHGYGDTDPNYQRSKYIPDDEANDPTFGAPVKRKASEEKGKLAVKQLQEIWNPKEFSNKKK